MEIRAKRGGVQGAEDTLGRDKSVRKCKVGLRNGEHFGLARAGPECRA